MCVVRHPSIQSVSQPNTYGFEEEGNNFPCAQMCLSLSWIEACSLSKGTSRLKFETQVNPDET